jgi:site-specific recombinase XerD
MAATTASTSLVPVQPVFTDAERLALTGFLAGYRGLTREAYILDLRQFTAWCRARSLPLFSVRRADIETFARELEARGRARAIDLAIGERTDGPLFIAADGQRLDRHGAARIVRRVTRRAGIAKHVSPHTLRHAFITAALDAGVPLRDVQEAASHADPRTTMRYDRARTSLDRHATYIVAAFIAGAAR